VKRADLIILGRPSVAIADGRLLFAGPREGALRFAADRTESADFGDARVLPGFRDAHAHLVMTAMARRRIDLHGLSAEEVRERIAERARTTPPGIWIEGTGFELNHLGLATPPSAADLAGAAPDHPVKLASHDLHALWVNDAALAAVGRGADAPSYLTEDEVRIFNDLAGRPGPEERIAATRDVIADFHAAGITAVQEHGTLEHLDVLLALAEAGELAMRVRFTIRQHEFEEYLERAPDLRRYPGLLDVNGMKMFLDGALGSRTAWTLEPYLGEGGTGHQALDTDFAQERVLAAAKVGFPTFFHAIGDAAVRQALDLSASAPGLRHSVEHAQLIHPDDLPRFAAQGVTASLQPLHLLTDTPFLIPLWGEGRSRRSFPVRSLLRSGAEVKLGSDTPVETFDPMMGLFATVARRTLDGQVLPGDETVPVETALSLYASLPATTAGLPADLSVWPEDPAEVPVERLPDLSPAATVFAGQIVYRA
jgi:predicted amidohydrolase YtcJ